MSGNEWMNDSVYSVAAQLMEQSVFLSMYLRDIGGGREREREANSFQFSVRGLATSQVWSRIANIFVSELLCIKEQHERLELGCFSCMDIQWFGKCCLLISVCFVTQEPYQKTNLASLPCLYWMLWEGSKRYYGKCTTWKPDATEQDFHQDSETETHHSMMQYLTTWTSLSRQPTTWQAQRERHLAILFSATKIGTSFARLGDTG